jgi:hypothetical protein
MVEMAQLSTTKTAEIASTAFRFIGASLIVRIGLLMIDPAHFSF